MKRLRLALEVIGCLLLAGCTNSPPLASQVPSSAAPVTPYQLYRETNVKIDLVPKGVGTRRYYRPLKPTYITIHSTQNKDGNAYNHALALKRYTVHSSWHFTVQEDVAIQHLPTSLQGRHAENGGRGDLSSIGIEMCEHRGNNLARTVERTAALTAYLMYVHRIPLSHVVPHYHWPRAGFRPANKNCPHFLLDNGKPGGKWRWYLSRVDLHYRRLTAGPIVTT